jgi:hypothetical protein
MFGDLRHGLRLLVNAKGWTAVVVLSLALGIGANTALFSAVNGLLLKQLAANDPETLVRVRWAGRNDMATDSNDYGFSAQDAAGERVRATFSYAMFQEFAEANRTLTDLFACAPVSPVNVVVDGRADIASALVSSGNYYQVLGVKAHLGRTLVPADDRPSAPPVAVISYRYWRSRFAGDAQVLGKPIHINHVPVTIVGVLPPEFTGVQQAVSGGSDIFLPIALDPQLYTRERRLAKPTHWWVQVMGRLKPGVTPEHVRANLEGVFRHQAKAGLDAYLASLPEPIRSASFNRNRTDVPQLRVDSGSRGIYDVRPTDLRAVTILGVVVALVLLIVCANVANLLLSRVLRLVLRESMLLVAAGVCIGVAVALGAGRFVASLLFGLTATDTTTIIAAIAVMVLVAAIAAYLPARRAARVDPVVALRYE